MYKAIIAFFSFLCFISGSAQPVPTSYGEAKKLGDDKFKMLLKANTPEDVRYVDLNSGGDLARLLKYENSVYVVNTTYDLKGKTVTVPKNSVIVFRNGNIRNGTLQGENAKYAANRDKAIGCQLRGQFERIAFVYTASELGLRSGDKGYADFNNAKLQEIIKRGLNIFLDGVYYFSFSKPILLKYQLHLFGGEFFFSKYAFDLAEGGGMFVNGVHFSSIRKGVVDDILCGTREKHSAITTAPLVFLNCRFSCNRVISLSFKDINPKKTPYGIPFLHVSRCYADRTGKFIILNAVVKAGCTFRSNIWQGFNSAPIYLTCSHSKRAHPEEAGANPWSEEIIEASGDVVIDSNVFVGKEVTDNSYYCAALVNSKRCFFSNNYLKDLINISDKNGAGYTAYDAYLSCVDVIYKNNYIEDLMSFTKDGANKPQCEIGKSKTNPLEHFGIKARREYTDNVFVSDGKRFKDEGADPESIYANIFNNVSPIDEYIWARNAIIYHNITIKGRASSSKYRSFSLMDNYFECESLSGNLVFPNAAYNLDKVIITGNSFRIRGGKTFTLFNQLYNEDYAKFKHGLIDISDNSFSDSAPVYYFYTADTVRIKRNRVSDASLGGMAYLNNYSGRKTTIPISVRDLESELTLDTHGASKGGVVQMFSSSSVGNYSVSMKDVPGKGVNFTYVVAEDHHFQIALSRGKETSIVDFTVKNGRVHYSYKGKTGIVNFGGSKPITWYSAGGVVLKSAFQKNSQNLIVTSLSGRSKSDIVLEYRGR